MLPLSRYSHSFKLKFLAPTPAVLGRVLTPPSTVAVTPLALWVRLSFQLFASIWISDVHYWLQVQHSTVYPAFSLKNRVSRFIFCSPFPFSFFILFYFSIELFLLYNFLRDLKSLREDPWLNRETHLIVFILCGFHEIPWVNPHFELHYFHFQCYRSGCHSLR